MHSIKFKQAGFFTTKHVKKNYITQTKISFASDIQNDNFNTSFFGYFVDFP